MGGALCALMELSHAALKAEAGKLHSWQRRCVCAAWPHEEELSRRQIPGQTILADRASA